MGVQITQRGQTRNQSTADFLESHIFIFDNRYQTGLLKNNTTGSLTFQSGIFVARAAGTYETATVTFVALTTGQTMILGGLTYTSTGATTGAQLAAAFANLDAGATTGAGTATGTYSGTLTGWATGPASGAVVVFTALTPGNVSDLAATGTGTAPSIVIVQGTSATASGLIPVTSSNLANIVGIARIEGSVAVNPSESLQVNYCTHGTVDGNLVILPSGVTWNTVVSTNFELLDIVEGLGIHVDLTSVENTKYDN